MHEETRESLIVRRRYLVIALAGALVFVAWLGSRDLWYPDEPDIGEVARVMFESGDWVLPLRNGEPWIDYPPMLYWTGCTASHAFGGVTPFSLRLPSALAAIVLALLTCAAASRMYGARAGLWAGILLLTFTQFVYNAVAYRPDMLFALFVGAGLLVYLAGAGERPRWWLRVLGFVLLGLAVLTKGPLGLLLPGLVLTLWHLVGRRWRRVFELAPLGLVAVIVAAPWYVLCADAMGAEAMWREIRMQNLDRFGEGVVYQGHIRPVWYYLVNIWGDLAPWSFLLPFAAAWAVSRKAWRAPGARALLWWFATFFVFLSLAATKRQLYLVPAYPAAAILVAPWFAALARGVEGRGQVAARVFGRTVAVLLGTVGVLGLLAGALLDPLLGRIDLAPNLAEIVRGFQIPGLVTAAASLLLAVWIGRAAWPDRPHLALARTAASVLLLWALLLGLVLPTLDPVRTYAPAAQWIRAEIGDETRFGLHYPERGRNRIGGFAYHAKAYIDLLDDESAVERFFEHHPGSVVLVYEPVAEAFFEAAQGPWRDRVIDEVVADRRRYLVLKVE